MNFSKELLRIGQETAPESSKALIEASAGGVLFGAGELQTRAGSAENVVSRWRCNDAPPVCCPIGFVDGESG